jgi:hypothetical protein
MQAVESPATAWMISVIDVEEQRPMTIARFRYVDFGSLSTVGLSFALSGCAAAVAVG